MSAESPAKRKRGRPLSPCGTSAAIRRHWRNGEPIDELCSIEEARRRREEKAAEKAAEAAARAPQVTYEEGVLTIVASLDDARAIAAAALDRGMALEKTAGATAQAVDHRRKGEMLLAVHKSIVTIARAEA